MSLLPAGRPALIQKQAQEEAAVLAGSHVSPGRNRQGAGGRGGGQRGTEEEEGEEEEGRQRAGNGKEQGEEEEEEPCNEKDTQGGKK